MTLCDLTLMHPQHFTEITINGRIRWCLAISLYCRFTICIPLQLNFITETRAYKLALIVPSCQIAAVNTDTCVTIIHLVRHNMKRLYLTCIECPLVHHAGVALDNTSKCLHLYNSITN